MLSPVENVQNADDLRNDQLDDPAGTDNATKPQETEQAQAINASDHCGSSISSTLSRTMQESSRPQDSQQVFSDVFIFTKLRYNFDSSFNFTFYNITSNII